MAWEVTHGEQAHRVEVQDLGDGRWRATIDGEAIELNLSRPERGLVLFDDGPSRRQAWMARTADGWEITVDRVVHSLGVMDERRKALLALAEAAGGTGSETIATSMPGKIVTLLVAVGDVVEPGQGIVVVEAMKMENELKASRAGTVSAIHVEPGQAVEGGTTLVEIAPPDEEQAS